MIEIWRLPKSGDFDFDSTGQIVIRDRWALRGTDEELTAYAFASLNTPVELGGITRSRITGSVAEGHTDLWNITVIYRQGGASGGGGYPPVEIGEERESFSTAGGRTKLFQSLETLGRYAPSGQPATDHGGAINRTPDKVEGVDIEVPGMTFQIQRLIPSEQMTTSYRRNLLAASKKTNSAVFRGYQPGELWLKRVDAQQRDADSWSITFVFVASENLTSYELGTGPEKVVVGSKPGHAYAWAEHQKVTRQVGGDNGPKYAGTKLRTVHVERIYDSIDFAGTLGLLP